MDEVKICQRCGFEWEPRVLHPKKCPSCTSRAWDKPVKVEAQG